MLNILMLDEKAPFGCVLEITQMFFVRDWMTPDKYCCTKELLRYWLCSQRKKQQNNVEFLDSVSKVADLANLRQKALLIDCMYEQVRQQTKKQTNSIDAAIYR